MRKCSVQRWVDELPRSSSVSSGSSQPESIYSPRTNTAKKFLTRDWSYYSDDSHGSSVESYLEMRRPDPEEVLMELGFGPRNDAGNECRIPARFLQPSKLLPQIDFNKFLEKYGVKLPEESKSYPPTPAKERPKSC